MGLTIHYKLRLPATATAEAAAALVRTAHRRASALVRRRHLANISPVRRADPKDHWCHALVKEPRGESSEWHEVPPQCGWMFEVDPGRDCEEGRFGLFRYPATIWTRGRKVRTGCTGWCYDSFSKTQYASLHGEAHFLRCHRAIIDLLLIWERLGATVTINDEGDYWPGRNEAALLSEVRGMNCLVAALSGAIKDAADENGPPVEAPIFQHDQFELLEAQGLDRHGAHIGRAVAAIKCTAGHLPA
jgi:hypothetical protein